MRCMQFDENRKNQLGTELVKTLANALKEGKIDERETAKASSFLLSELDNIQSHEQIITFLTQLTVKWPIFENVLVMEKSYVADKVEDQKVAQMEKLIKENKLNDALQIGKAQTNTQGGVN